MSRPCPDKNFVDVFSPEFTTHFDQKKVKRHQVFISYAREDSKWMHDIRDALDAVPDFHIKFWVDRSRIDPGHSS